ncbi:tetratricopeptide repeat protein [Candidatus Ruminimicrobium bovinum]|uniref:tetratricopeptide repeat protein n=1 Tax=Candidatus Ruminimicrobium bovinum TaxID=3242779 RepID=UPI0039B9086A
MNKNKYKNFIGFIKKNRNTIITILCFVTGIVLFAVFVKARLNILANDASYKLTIASNYIANNNIEQGFGIIDDIIDQYSNTTASYRARFMKATHLISEKQYEQAEVLLKYIIDNGKPKTVRPLAYPSLILIYEETGSFDKAIEYSNMFLNLYSDNYLVPSVMENLARFYKVTNKVEQANDIYQKIKDNYPNSEYSVRAEQNLNDKK